MDCKVCASVGDLWFRVAGYGGGPFSHKSDHDFRFSDLIHLVNNISFYKCAVDRYESDLVYVVHSLLLSMSNKDIQIAKLGLCKGSCIRFALAKLLRHSGYDAAVREFKWQGCSKVPGVKRLHFRF